MDTLYPCCAGPDIHKEIVVACVRKAMAGGKVHHPHYSWPSSWSRQTDGFPPGRCRDSTSRALEAPRPLTPNWGTAANDLSGELA